MKAHILPSLALRPLATISPSSFTTFRVCPLHAVWAAHFSPLLPRSPQTRIGTVIHHLWEAAAIGKIADELAFDISWQTEIDAQEREMAQDWMEAHLVPLSRSIRDLEVRRLRCRTLLTGRRSRSRHRTLHAEQMIVDRTGIVKGRIDIILTDAFGTHLIDLKTGSLTNSNGMIKEEYVQQLCLYAALYHQNTGNWPKSLTLRTIDGVDLEPDWTPDKCDTLLAEALYFHAQINERISNGERAETLAKPHPDSCRYCRFRPGCSQYWHARQSSDHDEWPTDVMGHVENLKSLGNGQWKLRLINNAETIDIRGLTPERQGFLATRPLRTAFYNLRKENAGQYQEGPMTIGYEI